MPARNVSGNRERRDGCESLHESRPRGYQVQSRWRLPGTDRSPGCCAVQLGSPSALPGGSCRNQQVDQSGGAVQQLQPSLNDRPQLARDSSSRAHVPFAKQISRRLVAKRLDRPCSSNCTMSVESVEPRHVSSTSKPGLSAALGFSGPERSQSRAIRSGKYLARGRPGTPAHHRVLRLTATNFAGSRRPEGRRGVSDVGEALGVQPVGDGRPGGTRGLPAVRESVFLREAGDGAEVILCHEIGDRAADIPQECVASLGAVHDAAREPRRERRRGWDSSTFAPTSLRRISSRQ